MAAVRCGGERSFGALSRPPPVTLGGGAASVCSPPVEVTWGSHGASTFLLTQWLLLLVRHEPRALVYGGGVPPPFLVTGFPVLLAARISWSESLSQLVGVFCKRDLSALTVLVLPYCSS